MNQYKYSMWMRYLLVWKRSEWLRNSEENYRESKQGNKIREDRNGDREIVAEYRTSIHMDLWLLTPNSDVHLNIHNKHNIFYLSYYFIISSVCHLFLRNWNWKLCSDLKISRSPSFQYFYFYVSYLFPLPIMILHKHKNSVDIKNTHFLADFTLDFLWILQRI